MKDIRPVKIFVNSANEGEIVCPKCEKTKTIHLLNNRITTKPIRVKCNCGYSFSIVLEAPELSPKYCQYSWKTLSSSDAG